MKQWSNQKNNMTQFEQLVHPKNPTQSRTIKNNIKQPKTIRTSSNKLKQPDPNESICHLKPPRTTLEQPNNNLKNRNQSRQPKKNLRNANQPTTTRNNLTNRTDQTNWTRKNQNNMKILKLCTTNWKLPKITPNSLKLFETTPKHFHTTKHNVKHPETRENNLKFFTWTTQCNLKKLIDRQKKTKQLLFTPKNT